MEAVFLSAFAEPRDSKEEGYTGISGKEFYQEYWERQCMHLKWPGATTDQSSSKKGTDESDDELHCWTRAFPEIRRTLAEDVKNFEQLIRKLRPFPKNKRYTGESFDYEHSTKMISSNEMCGLVHGHDVRLAKSEYNKEVTYKRDGELVSTDEIKMAWGKGFTVIIPRICRSYDVLTRMRNELELETEQLISCNMYATPKGQLQGLKVHYDDHCVIILQIHGSKLWKVATDGSKLNVELPRLGSKRRNVSLTGDVSSSAEWMSQWWNSIKLNAGDFLYVPRGWPHFAVSSASEDSVHVTVAIENEPHCSWESVFHLAILKYYHAQRNHQSESMSIVLLHVAIRELSNNRMELRKACLGRDDEDFETYNRVVQSCFTFRERIRIGNKRQRINGESFSSVLNRRMPSFEEVFRSAFSLLREDGDGLSWLDWILETEGKMFLNSRIGDSDLKFPRSAYNCKGTDDLELKLAKHLCDVRMKGDKAYADQQRLYEESARSFQHFLLSAQDAMERPSGKPNVVMPDVSSRQASRSHWRLLNKLRHATWEYFRQTRSR